VTAEEEEGRWRAINEADAEVNDLVMSAFLEDNADIAMQRCHNPVDAMFEEM